MFASLLIIILAFRPGGILPEKSSATLPWRTIAQIVESESRSIDGSSKPVYTPEQEKIERTDKPG
jgi:hypothetical protein